MSTVIVLICPNSIQKPHITIRKKTYYAANDDFTCEIILDLSDGEMYIFAVTDTVISYDCDCIDEYMVIVYSVSDDLRKMIAMSNENEYNKKYEKIDNLDSHKYTGPNDDINEVKKIIMG